MILISPASELSRVSVGTTHASSDIFLVTVFIYFAVSLYSDCRQQVPNRISLTTMAKRKKVSADNVRVKKKSTTTKSNPFEVKINRQKQHVLGRKISKHDKGKPGQSRSRAIQKVRHLV